MLTELGLILLLSILNGFFALSEMAIVASRKSRLKQMARHSARARVALQLAEHPDRFLSTVQVGITLVMLITGAVTGAALGVRFSALVQSLGFPWLTPYATAVGWLIGFIIVTTVQIIIGELVPKRIALVAPERLSSVIALPMLVLSRLCAPFVWVLNGGSTLLLKLFRLNKARRSAVSEEEIRLLVAEGAEQGILDPDEHNMVNRVLRLGDRPVDSVMTPRTRIAWLDAAASREENLQELQAHSFSRFPVYRGDESEVLGVVEVKRMLDGMLRGETDLFRDLVKPLYIPETARALDLLESFRDADTQMALVVDEYGDIEGLVTLNDVLSAVVGQSQPGEGSEQSPIMRHADGSWLIEGSLATEDLRELLRLDHLPNEDEHDFNTVAGMVMTAFARIPQVGDAFSWRGWRFEVARVDGARIDRVRVVAVPGKGHTATTQAEHA
ncbi:MULTISPECIES: hemolysin family protein [Oleiagrimonas]|uniref:HlyC/CorC family transporter n=1 Tax=Oleiagrimonas citrea TaxID=1665687 RepID=A0A846ZNU8_9GAMM|nr:MULTISPECIES: hemolysin family protein [Oleiagrimonas]NKZ39696.1 HlyC/CorC family transporter [Oleiagrimonas citrea]RAP59349.1 hemolysin [Oleiagrimonas sp. MCCC 1A03011]